MSIGERLKEARKAKGFSQDKLAEAIGTSRTVITDIERDKTEHPRVLMSIQSVKHWKSAKSGCSARRARWPIRSPSGMPMRF